MKRVTESITDPAEATAYDRLRDFVAQYDATEHIPSRIEAIAGIMRMSASLLVLQSRRVSTQSLEHSAAAGRTPAELRFSDTPDAAG